RARSQSAVRPDALFFFKQKTAYEVSAARRTGLIDEWASIHVWYALRSMPYAMLRLPMTDRLPSRRNVLSQRATDRRGAVIRHDDEFSISSIARSRSASSR